MLLGGSLKRVSVLPCLACANIHTSVGTKSSIKGRYERFGADREARFMKKLMTGTHGRKQNATINREPRKIIAEGSVINVPRTYSNRSKRRVQVLSVLFLESITSILSTGEAGTAILDLGLIITRVKVAPDFSLVIVYWKPSGTEKDELLENELKRCAGLLRHQLTQLRVIGNVPPIQFTKDPVDERITELEQVLAKCDFGEDHEPIETQDVIKNYFTRSSENKATAEAAGANHILQQTVEEIMQGPEMRNDILGLDHSKIMKKILQTTKKSKHPKSETIVDGAFEMSKEVDIGEDDPDKRRKEFLKYLQKMKLRKKEQADRKSAKALEIEFLQQIKEEILHESINNFTDTSQHDMYEQDDFDQDSTVFEDFDSFRDSHPVDRADEFCK